MPKKKNKEKQEDHVVSEGELLLDPSMQITGLPPGFSLQDMSGMIIDAEPRFHWLVSFEKLPQMNVASVKFTIQTTGEPTTGQVVMEIECTKGVNKVLNEWIKNPVYKDSKIEVFNAEGDLLDIISMKCRPIAMAVGDLGDEEVPGKPWCTTIQLSSQEIEYLDILT